MDLSSYFENNTFMTTPMIRKLSLKIQKQTKIATLKNNKKNTQNSHISSYYHRNFLSKPKSQKSQPTSHDIKQSIIIDNSAHNQKQRRVKTQQSQEKCQPSVRRTRQNSAYRRSHQKQPNNFSQIQINGSVMQNVKTKSLTFQCYYKNIKQIQSEEKVEINQKPHQKVLTKQLNRLFNSNINQQMLQSMKRHLKRGLKVIQVGQKFISQPLLNYGLDIKGIQTKKNIQNPSPVKGYKKYSTSSLLVVKKQSSLKKVQKIESSKTISNKRHSTIFNNNLEVKKKSIQSKSSKEKYNFSQKQEQKTIFTRLQGMMQNLNLILKSFECTWVKQNILKKEMQIENKNQVDRKYKKGQRFLYFVGYGNNRNIIRSLMKKRWWWTETEYINEADFIWTQIKITHILDQLEQEKQKCSVNAQKPQNILSESMDLNPEIIKLQKMNKSQINLDKNQNKSKGVTQKNKNYQKFYKIFHKNLNCEQIFNQNSNLKSQFHMKNIHSQQKVHNHYRLNYMFGNKNALFHNLKMYFEFLQQSDKLYNIIPKTYYLQKTNKSEIKRFHQKQFTSNITYRNGRKQNNIWIVKPAQNSNRGQGISVHNTFESIRKEICSSKNCGKFIVQLYMKNLFLYERRKFDIRTYMVMMTIKQTTKYFWYSEGYLRTSSEYYNLNDIQNIFVHLTNDAIQCDSETYGKYEPGNKLSYSQFQRYLDSNYQKQKYSVEELNIKMKNIATKAVQAIHPKLKTQKVQYSFELFGLDFLIDKHFNPWLVEINTNPCLQLGCPVLERLIPRMLQNMLRLGLDPMFQPTQQFTKASSYFIYDNFFDINRFQLIFDSNFDENEKWMEHCKNFEEKVYADDDEIFENDGQEMQILI